MSNSHSGDNPLYSWLRLENLLWLIGNLGVLHNLLAQYPGPKLAAATALISHYHAVMGQEHEWETALHWRYGETVRVAPDRMSFISPQARKDIFGPGAGKRLKNNKDKTMFGPDLRGERPIASSVATPTHRARCRAYAPAFSERSLKQQEPLILGYVNSLVRIVKDHATYKPNDGIDMTKLLNCTTFDIMADLSFGEPLGLLEQSEYTPWVQAIFGSIRFPSIQRFAKDYELIDIITQAIASASIVKAANTHYDHTYNRVHQRVERGIDIGKPDMWKFVMENAEQSNLSIGQMTADATAFMVAGSETTATLLSGLTYILLKHPEHMQRLKAEVRALRKDELTLEKLRHLPFMIACITEALRIYPPAPIPMFHTTPKGGNLICGDWMPESIHVGVAHYAAYHNPFNFKYPDSFIPERWFPGTGYEDDRKDAHNPFSVGPRNCIGQILAPESEGWMDQKVHILYNKPDLLVKVEYVH